MHATLTGYFLAVLLRVVFWVLAGVSAFCLGIGVWLLVAPRLGWMEPLTAMALVERVSPGLAEGITGVALSELVGLVPWSVTFIVGGTLTALSAVVLLAALAR